MNLVFLCGFGKEEEKFCGALSRYGEVLHLRRRSLHVFPSAQTTSPFFVWSCSSPPDFNEGAGILLLGTHANKKLRPPHSGLIAVFEADCAGAAEILKNSGCTAISCGTARQDTLSVSSWSERKIQISLQRGIRSLSGRTIEQREITVQSADDCDAFFAAAFCAVLLLCDRTESEFCLTDERTCNSQEGGL